MTDADVDGAHIRTLLLTLFYRYFPQLVNAGHIYIAQPPLYGISKGKEVRYVFSDAERDRAVRELAPAVKVPTGKPTTAKPAFGDFSAESLTGAESEPEAEEGVTKVAGLTIQRYKGLGEMNATQLWETTMDPAHRMLYQVTVEDAEEADRVFDVLMGSDVLPRKKFIQTHARSVQNLDI